MNHCKITNEMMHRNSYNTFEWITMLLLRIVWSFYSIVNVIDTTVHTLFLVVCLNTLTAVFAFLASTYFNTPIHSSLANYNLSITTTMAMLSMLPMSYPQPTRSINNMQTNKYTSNDLQRFNSVDVIINYVTICCNESIDHFGTVFTITQIDRYHYNSNNLDRHANTTSSSNINNNIHDVIVSCIHIFITKYKRYCIYSLCLWWIYSEHHLTAHNFIQSTIIIIYKQYTDTIQHISNVANGIFLSNQCRYNFTATEITEFIDTKV